MAVIHVPGSCHCYYYLDLATKEGDHAPADDAIEPDPHVMQLSKDVLAYRDLLEKRLPPDVIKYAVSC